MTNGIFQEHDSFVKDFFSELRWARELFRLFLPPELYNILDFTQLKAVVGEAAPHERKERRTDILFSVPLKRGGQLVYLYLEHSSGDKGGLVGGIHQRAEAIKKRKDKELKRKRKRKTDKIPGCYVISLLLYQSAEAEQPWVYRERPREYYQLPTHIHDILERFSTSGNLIVLDLAHVELGTLDTCLTMRAVLQTLKYIRHGDFKDKVSEIASWLEQEGELEAIERLGEYIMDYLGESMEKIDLLIKKLKETELGVKTMGSRQVILEAGIEEGRQLGEEKATLRIARMLLLNEASPELIFKSTGLTLEDLRKVEVLEE